MNTKSCSVAVLQRVEVGGWRTVVSAVALLLATAATVRAQNPDPRWQAWLGCWTPRSGAAPAAGAQKSLVCVTPLDGMAGVEIATVLDTQVVSRDTVLATGERRAISKDGCSGWESAAWSSEGQRVYLHSEYTCPGGLKRTGSGLMAFAPEGEWLDVRGIVVRGQTSVRVARYADAGLPATLPAEISSVLRNRGMAGGMSRMAATAQPTNADVLEASRSLDPALIEAWLAENGQGFELDARQLAALSDSGVANRVIDVMIALSYPKAFAVKQASSQGEVAPVGETRRSPEYADNLYGGYGSGCANPWGYYSPSGFYNPWDWDYYGAWASSGYGCSGYSPFGYSPYGYSPYGYGYNPWYGGGWNGGGTVVVIVAGGQAQPHGHVQKGQGYVQNGQAGGSGTPARPRDQNAAAERRAWSSGSISVERSGSSSSWSGSSTGSSSSGRSGSSSPSSGSSAGTSSSSGGGRTAHPRP